MVDEESIGGSRFDVAVRAMKGDFDPPKASEDTEKRSLLEALVQFPSFYTFSIVGKVETTSKAPGKVFTKDTLETVERICGTKLATGHYSVREKAGGKYISMRITTLVQSADLVKATYDELLKDPRVIMAY
ncbi:hypothetical protein KFL_001730220 [Klebsormidium nitens]|uniref:DUF493 domain-containing protein n=1 Tax=Klebsormidium nitens TaxID=105231 RepID=A0A1Y1I3P4_KLENI|nr:hypothetical protein KFL_001730220 [Klebsormidium nitens]|eukprot:GAQ84029.1 hypothetical protein KFL_001730220 [Klebsormidium nitens]